MSIAVLNYLTKDCLFLFVTFGMYIFCRMLNTSEQIYINIYFYDACIAVVYVYCIYDCIIVAIIDGSRDVSVYITSVLDSKYWQEIDRHYEDIIPPDALSAFAVRRYTLIYVRHPWISKYWVNKCKIQPSWKLVHIGYSIQIRTYYREWMWS